MARGGMDEGRQGQPSRDRGNGWQVIPCVGFNGSNAYRATSTTGGSTNSATWCASVRTRSRSVIRPISINTRPIGLPFSSWSVRAASRSVWVIRPAWTSNVPSWTPLDN